MAQGTDVDAVIVGAGVAGLAAARRLRAHGINFVILEARDRIGGRLWTIRDDRVTVPMELGAEFLHADARETRKIAHLASLAVIDVKGRRWESKDGSLRPMDDFEARLHGVMSQLNPDRDPDRSCAEALTRLKALGTRDRRLAERFVEGFHSADAELVSEQSLADTAEDPEALEVARVLAGYDSIVVALGDPVQDRIRTGRVVTRIVWGQGSSTIESVGAAGQSRDSITARAVVVAVPLGVLQAATGEAGHIAFDPPVPAIHRAASKLVMGGVIRVALAFDEPFWTSERFASRQRGQEFRDMTFVQSLADEPFPTWWTAYPTDAALLVGWWGGPRVWDMAGAPEEETFEAALQSLAALFGMTTRALRGRLRGAFMHNWLNDPYTRGAYSYVGVGGSGASAAIARPVHDTLYFAGEHASAGRNGTVDGAIASGYRAAEQLLRGL